MTKISIVTLWSIITFSDTVQWWIQWTITWVRAIQITFKNLNLKSLKHNRNLCNRNYFYIQHWGDIDGSYARAHLMSLLKYQCRSLLLDQLYNMHSHTYSQQCIRIAIELPNPLHNNLKFHRHQRLGINLYFWNISSHRNHVLWYKCCFHGHLCQ